MMPPIHGLGQSQAAEGLPSVLVIDDGEDDRFLIRHALEKAGYDVTEAASGKEGLDKFRLGVFAVVVCDYEMPGMGGEQVISQIKAQAQSQKVILHSTKVETLDNAQKQAIGADRFVTKEADCKNLVAAVKELTPQKNK